MYSHCSSILIFLLLIRWSIWIWTTLVARTICSSLPCSQIRLCFLIGRIPGNNSVLFVGNLVWYSLIICTIRGFFFLFYSKRPLNFDPNSSQSQGKLFKWSYFIFDRLGFFLRWKISDSIMTLTVDIWRSRRMWTNMMDLKSSSIISILTSLDYKLFASWIHSHFLLLLQFSEESISSDNTSHL